MSGFRFPLAFCVLAVTAVFSVGAQVTDTLLLGSTVQSFSRAGHLGVSPDGRLYIPDRDRNMVHVLAPTGAPLRVLGGPGLSEGQFDDPSDVDPAIGLVISVVDTQNSRIQRFTREFRFIESIPVVEGPDIQSEPTDPSFRSGEARVQALSNGHPVAISSSVSDDLYVVNAASDLVMRISRERRATSWIGEKGRKSGVLIEPVDVLVSGPFIYVADRGCACIQVYDQFGTFERTLSDGLLTNIAAVSHSPDGILAVLPDRLIEYSSTGLRERETVVSHDEPIIDAALTPSRWIILSETGLFFVQNRPSNGNRPE